MDNETASNVRQALEQFSKGDRAALDRFLPLVYKELHHLAQHYLRQERPDHTLQPTELVHEAYLRLLGQREVDWRNRAQFIGIAAQMMRRILINYAEARNAGKRAGYANRVLLDEALDCLENSSDVDVLALDHALNRLSQMDERQGRVVELRCFGGLSVEETAEVLAVSPATVKREWAVARLWLRRELSAAT